MTEPHPNAFPSPDWNGFWNGPEASHGMTLRDWFAGQAISAIRNSSRSEELAFFAYRIADAMLAERIK